MNGQLGASAAAGPSSAARLARPSHRSSPPSRRPSSPTSPSLPDPLSTSRSARTSSPDMQRFDQSTRPALARRTTETAALAGDQSKPPTHADGGLSPSSGEGPRRRSMADTRKAKGKEREPTPATGDTADAVEVLIHELRPADSLPRIALLYGIDLAVLRKSNKLWTSDSLHVRKTIYIPLSACHLREELVRGPADDEVTLVQLPAAPSPSAARAPLSLSDVAARRPSAFGHPPRAVSTPNPSFGTPTNPGPDPNNPWLFEGADGSPAEPHLDATLAHPASPLPPFGTSRSPPPPTTPIPSDDPPPRPSRVLKVARVGRKDLSFFPRSAPATARASLDSSLLQRTTPTRRSPSSATTSPSLSRKLSNLFLDVPNFLPPVFPSPSSPLSPSAAPPTLLGNGRPTLYARARSASDFGHATPPPRDSVELDSPEAEHVELARLTAPRPPAKADWFSPAAAQTGRQPAVIRQQVAPVKPMMVVRDAKPGVDRRAGDGLGDGRIKDVWIG